VIGTAGEGLKASLTPAYAEPVDVDVVVVSYNSRAHLSAAVEPFARDGRTRTIVVDSASSDGSLESVARLADESIALPENRGFAFACNRGWRAGTSSLVLFLNPDARIELPDLERLAEVLERRPEVGCVGPRIVGSTGRLEFSQRRFPRLRSRYAQALFLHRLFPRARWADEVIRDDEQYAAGHPAEWLSGACLLIRRTTLEELDGMDDSFFLYCEDVDLCRRVWSLGQTVWFEPSATCVHAGGASAPRPALLPVLAASRVRYAAKHFRPAARAAERLGIALAAATHAVVSRGGRRVRAGHVRSLVVAFSRRRGQDGRLSAPVA
jgi:N-acetylglucosaminyl-diphospho-decaprenol L-rhamnosyltransferase